MEMPSSSPPCPKNAAARDQRDTWRPSSAPPKARTESHASSIDQRKDARARVRHTVEFSIGAGRREPGVCRNLSLGGVAIQTAEPAPFGSRVVV
ncbi:MAG TPA: PilZ domain-containing protein, partial [Polyangiaceae bacterium]|nr:PilZ domain-containing protein [Polyangiaceae bacterium]